MTVKYSLPEIVHYHRKRANLSRKALADLAEVGKTAIYDVEKGKPTVRWSTITAILRVLNIEVHWVSPLMNDYEKSLSKDA